MSIAAAQIARRIETARVAIVIFDGGVGPPVASIGTLPRLADRWFSFVRAIDSSFSAAVASRWAFLDAGTRGGCPALFRRAVPQAYLPHRALRPSLPNPHLRVRAACG
ncbi:hypothetical protein KRMM14A1004_23460 [Krasilnikovia sp. MM14-A1004]